MGTPDKNVNLKKVLAAKDLPSPSAAALRLIRELDDENISLPRLENVLQSDPAFVAKLIQVANSGRSAVGARPIVAIKDALLVLGIPAIRGIAIGFSLFDNHRTGQCKAFDHTAFWLRSLAVAQAFQFIVKATRIAPPDEAFCIGLLSNIGMLAMATAFPEPYARLLADTETMHCLEEREIATLGFDHWELGAEMLTQWGLPTVYVDPVKLHLKLTKNQAVENEGRRLLLTNALILANIIADLILAKEQRTPEKVSELYLYGARISLEASTVVDVGKEVAEGFKKWMGVLKLSGAPWMDFSWVAAAAENVQVLSHAATNDAKSFSVLLVDDDRATRTFAGKILADCGYRVLIAESAEQALILVEKDQPDLIVTDWIMPGMDGLELIKHLRAKSWGAGLYTLVVTARTEEDHLVQAFDAGTNDFITKPIAPRVLISRLKAGERMVRLQRETERQYKEMKQIASELSASNRRLQELSVTDVLTGCPNRRFAIDRLQREWASAERRGNPLSCLVVDLDWFKQVNDIYGHERGDEVLKLIADVLRAGVRTEDVVCRVGGDEFWVICPGAKKSEAVACAERLCKAVADLNIRAGDHQCSISVGVAERSTDDQSPAGLIDKADKSLYQAKHDGRSVVRFG